MLQDKYIHHVITKLFEFIDLDCGRKDICWKDFL